MTDAIADDEIFAGNRAVGRVALTVATVAGVSRRVRVHEAGSLRVRFPNGANAATLEAVLVNTAGGMAGGDRFGIEVAVGAGARLALTSAAAEKVYRSHGPDTTVDVKLDVGPGAALAWLPQELILFDRGRVKRAVDIALAPDSALMLAEAVVFGRSAMNETVRHGRFFDRWRVRVGGALAFADTVHLDGDIAGRLAQRAVAGEGVAIATVLKFPGDEAGVAAVRAIGENCAGEVGISCWNGFALARLVARDGAALRRDLIGVVAALGGTALPRLWLN